MKNTILTPYIYQFQHLNRAHNLGGAPHKPILLLSIAQLISDGTITDNRMRITEELVVAFKDNWFRFVTTPHLLNFALPFFHMGHEPFWRLVPYPRMEIGLTESKSIKSFKNLRETLNYAWMDQPLFDLLRDPIANQVLTNVLLDTYFPLTKHLQQKAIPLFLDEPESLMMAEHVEPIWEMPIRKVTKDVREQEVFLRSAKFKVEIPRVYNYQCAISGLQVTSTKSTVKLIEACHIKPFSISETETIGNGILLTPTLHKAFDAGFIAIDSNYYVHVSKTITENNDSPYALGQLKGRKIGLPAEQRHYPSRESLEWHWKERFLR